MIRDRDSYEEPAFSIYATGLRYTLSVARIVVILTPINFFVKRFLE